jgi:hypothetical protein
MGKQKAHLSDILINGLSFCLGDHALRRDDPHALRDALTNCDIIISKESAGASFFNEFFQF